MKIMPDVCPTCGADIKGTIELIPGIANVSRNDDGSYQYSGETTVLWDLQRTEVSNNSFHAECENGHEFPVTMTGTDVATIKATEMEPKVIVVVEGGVVQSVLSDKPVLYYVKDFDNIEGGDKLDPEFEESEHVDSLTAALRADVPEESIVRYCHHCKGPFLISESGATNHIKDDDEIDYQKNRDHVPFETDETPF